jgi:hypothetical protein
MNVILCELKIFFFYLKSIESQFNANDHILWTNEDKLKVNRNSINVHLHIIGQLTDCKSNEGRH